MPPKLQDFDYNLPAELIAQQPLAERAASRLLTVREAELEDHHFSDLPGLLRAGDLLVLNDSRVIHARLRGVKPTGGRVEVLIERLVGVHEALAQVSASHPPRPGSHLLLEETLEAEVICRVGEFFHLRFGGDTRLLELLERHGRLPLPPYIERAADIADETRYQTVYAREPGSVAAPTAGLHFDDQLLAALRARDIRLAYLTLHVGAGTFQPVRVEDLAQHRMHKERYVIPAETADAVRAAKARGGRVVAVGTTALRALESAALEGDLQAGGGETELFILPGFRFRVADCLVTNFHLPRSTLLMLVSAFGGQGNLRRAYQHAVARRYRFFSYGDASLIFREDAVRSA